MPVDYLNPTPGHISGHHFSDILSCPRRAWLNFYGNRRFQVKDPAYLMALQQEGIEFERSVYKKHYPHALKIPQNISSERRRKMTLDAMRAGEEAILQGYLTVDECTGVIDVLERIPVTDGIGTHPEYRIGEIKHSTRLMTSHVMQAAWYTDLLEKSTGYKQSSVFFYLGDGKRHDIDLSDIWNEYQDLKNELFDLRNNGTDPGPHLTVICPTCHWREICMPELIEKDHLSLIPGIGRSMAGELSRSGISSWRGISDSDSGRFEDAGYADYEIERLNLSLKCLRENSPPLKFSLRPNLFDGARIFVLEFPELLTQRKAGVKPVVRNIYLETDDDSVERFGIPIEDQKIRDLLRTYVSNSIPILFGSTDRKAFRRVLGESGIVSPELLDLFMIIETAVHSPLPGLELESILSFIAGEKQGHLNSLERVKAMRQVVNWISRSL